MGWCSGTPIFDKVAHIVLDNGGISEQQRYNILLTLIDALEDHDWDCQEDSEYFNHPTVQKVIRNLHPNWFEDNVSDG